MGTFTYRVEVGADTEGPFAPVDALVDTGSLYSWIPGTILRDLGLTPAEEMTFVTANGQRVTRSAVEAPLLLEGRIRHTICIFGEDGDLTLLGAYALEGFALAADPVNKRLVPIDAIPAASTRNVKPKR